VPAASDLGRRCAAALALSALVACGSGPGITPIRTAFNKGVYHHSRGELDAAIAEYQEAVAEDPTDQRARFNLASAHDELGRSHREAGRAEDAQREFAIAEAGYREVLKRDPVEVRAGVNLAALEYEKGDQAAGEARLQAAIAAHRDLALPRTALALRRLQVGQIEAARTLLREALAAEPLDVGANLLMGDVCVRLGEVDAARAAYRTALRREPDDAAALVALARLELGAGHDSEALALLRQVVLGPGRDNLEAHLLLADVCGKRGELEDAVSHLWRARELDGRRPCPVDYRARLAASYQKLLELETAPVRH
jgi:tetratricopeptide (TPR) repeat protein